MEAGKPFQIHPTGPCDIRRIEAGILNWGADITLEDTPYHVGLERLVDQDRTDYIGADALARIRAVGVARRLVGIEISGRPLEMNATQWPVHSDEEPVGHVTSAVFSPRLQKNIGYAMLPAARATIGTKLLVGIPGVGERKARVAELPFIDQKKAIPKS